MLCSRPIRVLSFCSIYGFESEHLWTSLRILLSTLFMAHNVYFVRPFHSPPRISQELHWTLPSPVFVESYCKPRCCSCNPQRLIGRLMHRVAGLDATLTRNAFLDFRGTLETSERQSHGHRRSSSSACMAQAFAYDRLPQLLQVAVRV